MVSSRLAHALLALLVGTAGLALSATATAKAPTAKAPAAKTPPASAPAAPSNPDDELVRSADRSRGHLDTGLEYKIDVRCSAPQMDPVERTIQIRSRGPKATATVLAPADKQGDVMLVQGGIVWQLLKSSQRPLAVTPSQRMSGGLASVADIVSTGFAATYAAKLDGDEPHGGEPARKLTLTARKLPASYEHARYWISAKTGLGLAIELLGEGDKPLRTVRFTYGNTLTLGKETIPFLSEAVVTEADAADAKCTVTYGAPRAVDTTEAEFDLGKLKPLQGP
jgi:hypothetical protein